MKMNHFMKTIQQSIALLRLLFEQALVNKSVGKWIREETSLDDPVMKVQSECLLLKECFNRWGFNPLD
jgi:hypothetical protein